MSVILQKIAVVSCRRVVQHATICNHATVRRFRASKRPYKGKRKHSLPKYDNLHKMKRYNEIRKKWRKSKTITKTRNTHYVGGWVGPSGDLDAVEKIKLSCLVRESNPCPPASIPSLYRLSYSVLKKGIARETNKKTCEEEFWKERD
jgi:hypothetical protein